MNYTAALDTRGYLEIIDPEDEEIMESLAAGVEGIAAASALVDDAGYERVTDWTFDADTGGHVCSVTEAADS